MWARVSETFIGCWLLMSPFLFSHSKDKWEFWANDLSCGLALLVLALASYWNPMRHAHLFILAIAIWLIGFGRFYASPPLPPALQNDILVGLVLALIAIVPNEASEPPRSWQDWYGKRAEVDAD